MTTDKDRRGILRSWSITAEGILVLRCDTGVIEVRHEWDFPAEVRQPGAAVVKIYTVSRKYTLTVGDHLVHPVLGADSTSARLQAQRSRTERATLLATEVSASGRLILEVNPSGTTRTETLELPRNWERAALAHLVPGAEILTTFDRPLITVTVNGHRVWSGTMSGTEGRPDDGFD